MLLKKKQKTKRQEKKLMKMVSELFKFTWWDTVILKLIDDK